MLKLNFHPGVFIILALMGLICGFCVQTISHYGLVLSWMLVNWLICARPLKIKTMLKFSLSLLPFGIAIVISCYYFADPSYGLTHPGLSRSMLGIYLATRMLSLALISFMWLSHCNVRALILELTAKKILTVHLGFALLAVINAKASLAAQFQQIQLAYRMRYQRGNYSPKILLPLLVAAARYAQTLSISLACRGLNPARSYHQSLAPLAIHDWCILLANLVIMLIILILL